jgi:hypothetical protein
VYATLCRVRNARKTPHTGLLITAFAA